MIKKCFCALFLLFCSLLNAQPSYQPGMPATSYCPHVSLTSGDSMVLTNGTTWQAAPGVWVPGIFSYDSPVIIGYSTDTSIFLANPITGQGGEFSLACYTPGSLPYISSISGTNLYATDGSRWLISDEYKYVVQNWYQGYPIIIMETPDSYQGMYQIIYLDDDTYDGSAVIKGIVTARSIH